MSIEAILKKQGPMLSGKLASELLKAEPGISVNAAKKRISRSEDPIAKLQLGFINNQSFVFLLQQNETNEFWEFLLRDLQENSKTYFTILNSIMFHFGYIKYNQLSAFSSLPILKLKSHILANKAIEDLTKAGLISWFDDNILKINQIAFKRDNFNRFKAVELAKQQVIRHFESWSKNINLTSFNTGKGLDDTAEFGKFQWCFTSPSYLTGISKVVNSELKPGFIIADILIGRQSSKRDVEFFISKIDILKQQKNLRTFLPVLICENLDSEALIYLRSKGIFVGFVREIFGENYADTLRLLMDTITDATKVIVNHPEKFFELTDKLAKMEGKFGNIKGDMFEFVVGYYYTLIPKPIQIGKVVTDRKAGKSKEIDVFINTSSQTVIVECKGYKSPVSKEYVEEWLNDKIPTIRNWVLNQEEYSGKEIIFELWSTSGFEEEALKRLEDASKAVKPSKYIIRYFNREEIRKMFSEVRNEKLKEVLDKYF